MLRIELRAAKIPWIGTIAYHYWFVVIQDDRQDRWEVWQNKIIKSYHPRHLNWGHLHYNLMDPHAGVGNGGSWVAHQWQGADGIGLAQLIEATPQIYPYADRYLLWPGPNSNTYVQWILNQASLKADLQPFQLCWRGWGKDFI